MSNEYTILYVEDDGPSRQVMQLIMKSMGVDSYVAFENSENFLGRVNSLSTQPNIILLDIHMVPHTGFEMLDMLRADEKFNQARIIALTASVMNEEIENLKQHGFDGAIAKPLSFREFPGLIKRISEGEAVWYVA